MIIFRDCPAIFEKFKNTEVHYLKKMPFMAQFKSVQAYMIVKRQHISIYAQTELLSNHAVFYYGIEHIFSLSTRKNARSFLYYYVNV